MWTLISVPRNCNCLILKLPPLDLQGIVFLVSLGIHGSANVRAFLIIMAELISLTKLNDVVSAIVRVMALWREGKPDIRPQVQTIIQGIQAILYSTF